MSTPAVQILLSMDKEKADQDVKGFRATLESIEKAVNFQAIMSGWNAVTGVIQTAGAALGKLVEGAAASELAYAKLATALGQAGGGSAEALKAYNDELERQTGYESEVIAATQQRLLQMGIFPNELEKVTRSVVALAASMDVDLSQAAQKVGLLIGKDDVNALADLGIRGDTVEGILGQLESRFSSATSRTQTFEGRINALKIEFGNLVDVFGEAVISSPEVANGLDSLRAWVVEMTATAENGRPKIDGYISEFVGGVRDLGQTIREVHEDLTFFSGFLGEAGRFVVPPALQNLVGLIGMARQAQRDRNAIERDSLAVQPAKGTAPKVQSVSDILRQAAGLPTGATGGVEFLELTAQRLNVSSQELQAWREKQKALYEAHLKDVEEWVRGEIALKEKFVAQELALDQAEVDRNRLRIEAEATALDAIRELRGRQLEYQAELAEKRRTADWEATLQSVGARAEDIRDYRGYLDELGRLGSRELREALKLQVAKEEAKIAEARERSKAAPFPMLDEDGNLDLSATSDQTAALESSETVVIEAQKLVKDINKVLYGDWATGMENVLAGGFASMISNGVRALVEGKVGIDDALKSLFGGLLVNVGEYLVARGTAAIFDGLLTSVIGTLGGLVVGPAAIAAGAGLIAAGSAMQGSVAQSMPATSLPTTPYAPATLANPTGFRSYNTLATPTGPNVTVVIQGPVLGSEESLARYLAGLLKANASYRPSYVGG